MKATHTEEPWRVKTHKSGTARIIGGPTFEPVALIANTVRQDANAARACACVNGCKGINPAAAPLLLAACKAIMPLLDADLDAVENWQDEADAIRAAIAKAEGGGQ